MRHAAATVLAASLVCAAPVRAGDHASIGLAGRTALLQVPAHLPDFGSRALVVVLHGGLGNAERIANGRSEAGLNMDAVAERDGFIVAYLNGTPITRDTGRPTYGWNAGGGCCGQPAEKGVDDVAYVGAAIAELVRRYGVDPQRVYGTGHSNGAMLTQRIACETHLYAAAITVSGPLNLETKHCAAAAGMRILAIHGADDENVPVDGGIGPKGLSRLAFKSEAYARDRFTADGATYTLQVVPGADHALVHIAEAIGRSEGVTLAEKSARFFGLEPSSR